MEQKDAVDAASSSVYVRVGGRDMYEEAQLVQFGHQEHVVSMKGGNRTIEAKNVLAASTLGPEGLNDMVNLDNLNEASILFNLRKRFAKNRIYTYTGAILISLNPYKNLGIYSPALVRHYTGQRLGQLPPHIFAIADTAYRSMMTNNKDQSILISGESGAGKTEAAKKVLQFVASVAAREKVDARTYAPHERILATQPILEAFGNAKTIRNDNSSRFGKLLDLQFDAEGYLIGASIHNYLLEQTRVVRQGAGERNYHAFYFMLEGADKTERDQWAIGSSKDYEYTKNGSPDLPGINSKYEYLQIKRAMTIAGLSAHEQHMSWTLVAAILFLGNIKFTGGEEARVVDIDPLNWACLLLQINARELEQALTTRVNNINNEKFVVKLTEQEAIDARDTLAKQLYARNFDWLVSVLNNRTDNSPQTVRRIRLLDIFGFEVFENNSFEQMCINYANERLQYQFNEHIFKEEQLAYKAEQIDASNFTYVDNQPAIDLFEKRPIGIVLLLDEESRFPRGNDKSFLQKITQHHSGHKSFKAGGQARERDMFTVFHYAGAVSYSTNGFLEKNRQRFRPELVMVMKKSHVQQYVNLFADEDDEKSQSRGGGGKKGKKTVGLVFRDQLQDLMKVLDSTTPHYVRCIKPNSFKSPTQIENDSVIHQLRYSGVLETIRIRQGGYPNRRDIKEFIQRYRVLRPDVRGRNDHDMVHQLMNVLGVNQSKYQIGKTKVFVRDDAYHYLEGVRNEYFHKIAVTVQKHWRGYVARKNFKKLKKAATFLNYWFRRYLQESDCLEEVKKALSKIQPRNSKHVLLKNIGIIEKLAIREKNVDTIVACGGIDVLLNCLKAVHNKDKEISQACVRALGRLAINQEYATAIAREGGVREIVKSISESKTFDDSAADSIQLLDHLSLVDKNVEVVVREGGVGALKQTLKSVEKGKEISEKIFLAAQAMGTLTKNARAARLIGRDDEAILNVVKSIHEKPKFARLCGFGINCLANLAENKHNWEAIVKSGGVDTVCRSMALHMGNNKIIKESSRVVCQLAKDPDFSEECGEQGAIPLALEFLKENPEVNGVPSLAMIESLCQDHPRNIDRLVACGGIETLLQILKDDPRNPEVLSRLMRTINMLAQSDPAIAEKIARSGGAKIIMEALRKHPELAELAKNAIRALMALADVDEATFEFIQGEGAVELITAALEEHPDDEELLEAGAKALNMFATAKDLAHAMDTIGRSRMEEQTDKNMQGTGQAIGIVGNLALIEENINKIVEEGGIPILLAVINGASAEADTKEACQRIIESGIRAIGRLLGVEKNAAEFLREGGLETLIALMKAHPQVERLMNACITCAHQLIATPTGYGAAMKSELADVIVGVINGYPQYETFCRKTVNMFLDVANQEAGIAKLVNAGAIKMCSKILETHSQKRDIVLPTVQLLSKLQRSHPELSEQIAGECGEDLIRVLLDNVDDPEVCLAVLKLLKALAIHDDNIAQYFKDLGIAETLQDVMDANPLNKDIIQAATNMMSLVAGQKDLLAAIQNAIKYARKLGQNPKDEEALELLGTCISLIASMSGDENNRNFIVDNRGLDAFALSMRALTDATPSLAQERVMEDDALGVNRLLGTNDRPMAAKIVRQGPLGEMLRGFIKHPGYEKLGEHEVAVLTEVTRSPELHDELFPLNTIEALSAMIKEHPLNDEMISSAVRLIGKLANTPEHGREAVRRGAGDALMTAVRHLNGIDKPLIDALLAVGRLADMCDSAEFALANDGIGDLIAVLANHTTSPAVEAAAANCIAALTQDPRFAKPFARSPGLDQIIKGLDRYQKHPDFCRSGVNVLENVANDPTNVPQVVQLKGVDAALQTIKRHPTDEATQAYGIRAMALCAEVDDPTCLELGSNDSVSPVLDALRRFPDSPEVTMSVAQFLRALARLDQNREDLNAKGAKDVMDFCMGKWDGYPEVQKAIQQAIAALDPGAAHMLANVKNGLANGDPHGILRSLDDLARMVETTGDIDFGKADAAGTLANVLQAYKHDAIATSAFRAAAAIAAADKTGEFAEEFCRSGGLQNLLDFMEEFPDNEEMMQEAVEALDNLAQHPNTTPYMKQLDVVPKILKAMEDNPDNEQIQMHGIRALNAIAANDPELNRDMGQNGAIPAAVEALKRFPRVAPVVQSVIEFLNTCGLDPENLPQLREAIPTVEWAAKGHPGNNKIQGLTAQLVDAYKLEEFDEETLPPPPPLEPIDFAKAANTGTKAEKFTGLRAAVQTLDDLHGDPDALHQAIEHIGAKEIDDATLEDLLDLEAPQKLVMALNKFRDDPETVKNVAKAINRVAANEDMIQEIVANGGIAALLKALKKHIGQPDTLSSGIALLGNLATNDHLKTLIGLQGGIRIILRAMELYPDHTVLLDKCCYCLANLAFNNPPNISAVVNGGGVKLVIDSMDRHSKDVDLMDSATCLLSNLCYKDLENKSLICREGGARVITQMLRDHNDEDDLIMTGFRCLGNLAFHKENIPLILREGATEAIVQTMKQNPENSDLVQLAIAVIQNLASVANKQNLQMVVDAKSVEAVIEASATHQDTVQLQLSALGCLGNISVDLKNATYVCKAGGVEMVLKTLRILDWEEQVVSTAFQLLGSLASEETNTRLIVANHGPAEVLRVMKVHEEQAPIIKLGLIALSKFVFDAGSAEACAKQGAIETGIDALVAYIHDDKMMIDAIRLLMNLSIVRENAHLVASNAVVPCLQGMKAHETDEIFLRIVASFMGNLAVFPPSAKLIVEQGVCQVFLETVRNYLDYPSVLAKLIRAMVNALMSSPEESKAAIRKEKGLNTVKAVLARHPNHQELKKACEAFIKKMTENPHQRRHLATDEIKTLREQIPPKWRNRMTAGCICRKFCKRSAPRKRHIRVTEDFEAVEWLDPDHKKPPHAVPIQAISEVRKGACTMQHKRTYYTHKTAAPDRSFAIFAEDNRRKPFTLPLECKTQSEMETWIEMLELLRKLHEPIGFKAM